MENIKMEKDPDFQLVCSLKLNDTIPIHKYKSTNTGINVYFAEVDGPLVYGSFAVATEAFDDDGLAHTLEHLLFQGSEKYPWNRVLDRLANRCLSSGTDALTDVDHTLFKLTTAGAEGFLTLIPIYLDHILYPILMESAYLTEVHHVTGEGEDGGVIYAEMQARENTDGELTYYEALRAMYPGKCGYKSNLGGLLKNLRDNTTNERVKSFHKVFYRPENLTIIITGQIKHSDLFEALRPLEEKIVSKGDRGPFTRPWQTPVPPLTESVVGEIHFPNNDEDTAVIYAGWRAPSVINEIYDFAGCEILLEYLTNNSLSVIQSEFIEIDDPFASLVETFTSENLGSALFITFEGVPLEKIPFIHDRLMKVLKDEYESGIDTDRMNTLIKKILLRISTGMESAPARAVSSIILLDALYGNTTEDLERRLNPMKDLQKLAEEPESYWLNLFKRYLIDPPMVLVKGIPSCAKQKELSEMEKNRIAKRIEKLGKEGLEQKERELQEAVTRNAIPVPVEVLTSVPVPSIDGIKFHCVNSYTTESSQQHPLFDVTKLPLYTYLDDYNSNFINMTIVMDTTPIDKDARPYLPLLMEALTESPIERNGSLVSHKDVVIELAKDTISYSADPWHCHSACVSLELELSKYEKGVQWIKELLYDTKFSVDRLKIIGTTMINDVSTSKRDGDAITSQLMESLRYNKESDYYTSSFMRQHQFLTKIMERLNTEDGQSEVLQELEAVRRILTEKKNMVLSMSVKIDKLAQEVADVYAPWKILEAPKMKNKKGFHVTHDWELLNRREDITIQGCVLGLGCEESAYLSQCTICLNDFQHPDFPSVLLCLQYLIQSEGPVWKRILGQGLAYGVNMTADPECGLLYLKLEKATNIIAAYKEVKSIVENHLNENKWDFLLYESAKSSISFGIIENKSTVADLENHAFTAHFLNVPHDFDHRFRERVNEVSIDDLERVAPKYLKDLFDPKQCTTTVVCHPSKAYGIAEAFKLFNHNLQVFTSLEESYLNDWSLPKVDPV